MSDIYFNYFFCFSFKSLFFFFFFFQAEDGIRDFHVTGVQTCALPISLSGAARSDARSAAPARRGCRWPAGALPCRPGALVDVTQARRFDGVERGRSDRERQRWQHRGAVPGWEGEGA